MGRGCHFGSHNVQVVHGGEGLTGSLLRTVVKANRRVQLQVWHFVLVSVGRGRLSHWRT